MGLFHLLKHIAHLGLSIGVQFFKRRATWAITKPTVRHFIIPKKLYTRGWTLVFAEPGNCLRWPSNGLFTEKAVGFYLQFMEFVTVPSGGSESDELEIHVLSEELPKKLRRDFEVSFCVAFERQIRSGTKFGIQDQEAACEAGAVLPLADGNNKMENGGL
jgi:hypothetical protein